MSENTKAVKQQLAIEYKLAQQSGGLISSYMGVDVEELSREDLLVILAKQHAGMEADRARHRHELDMLTSRRPQSRPLLQRIFG